MSYKIGILAIQGAFLEHEKMLKKLGVTTFQIRQPRDLINNSIDGFIIPGGESTVMKKLINDLKLKEPIQELLNNEIPTFGTCAGLILLANKIADEKNPYFSAINISVKRNAYGRQRNSFSVNSSFAKESQVPMIFIRGPVILEAANSVEVLARFNNHIVAAKEKNILVTSFHPELTDNTTVHNFFINFLEN